MKLFFFALDSRSSQGPCYSALFPLLDSALILLLDSATARPALLSLLSLSRAGPSPRPKHNRRPAPNRFYQLSDPVK